MIREVEAPLQWGSRSRLQLQVSVDDEPTTGLRPFAACDTSTYLMFIFQKEVICNLTSELKRRFAQWYASTASAVKVRQFGSEE